MRKKLRFNTSKKLFKNNKEFLFPSNSIKFTLRNRI